MPDTSYTAYSNNDPAVTFAYDSGPEAKGKLASLADAAGTASFSYDTLGRLSGESRMIFGANNAQITKSLSYDYNLDGSLWKLHYPSGAVITYTPNASGSNSAGRILSVVDSANNINYVTGATYGPDGAMTGFVNGGTITNRFTYNNRLQPCRITAGTGGLPLNCADSSVAGNVFDIAYDFHFQNNNNGNVYGITNYRDRSRDQTFTYDALNRLASAKNAGTDCSKKALNQNQTEYWGNNYTYDGWGNLTGKSLITAPQSVCGGEGLSVNADVTNRLQNSYGYDSAGNMTYDPTPGHQLTYTYDQENRITGAGGYAYTYDSDGNRVKKSNASTGTLYWYMTPGIVAESDLNGVTQSEYIFFNGERVARRDYPSGSISYYFSDHLKTASVITDSLGNIKSESDFYPWGGELQLTNNDSNHYKFTGKERDSETGLDYFGARYYSNGLGRFVTPDWAAKPTAVPYAELGDPQSLNLNSYVRNIPTTRYDADGHQDTVAGQNIDRDIRDLAAHRITKEEFDKRNAARAAGAAIGLVIVLHIVTRIPPVGGSNFPQQQQPKPQPAPQPGQPAQPGQPTTQPATTAPSTPTNPTGPNQPTSNPMQGAPDGTSTTTHPDGSTKQTRSYGADGYPKTDVDHGHDHGQGDPHAHDWNRPADGSPPTHQDRQPGRPVKPDDPK